MKVLVTGAFGNVGLSVISELLKRKIEVVIFEKKNSKNKRIAKKFKNRLEVVWGDIRKYDNVEPIIDSVGAVIHLASIIPPLADKKPKLAHSVNVNGTANIIRAIEESYTQPKLIYTSSIAVYGDRISKPMINTTDSPNPNANDYYAQHKLECENLIQNSDIKSWLIFRLTYIVSVNKLTMDPIMFEMPLDTSIEVCDTKDTGIALANAVVQKTVWNDIFNIAGGEKCRIKYKDYLNRMMRIFGLGGFCFPEYAFSKGSFHCGYMNTNESQKYFNYQNRTIDDYFKEVKEKYKYKRFFTKMFRFVIRKIILNKSVYYKKFIRNRNLKASIKGA